MYLTTVKSFYSSYGIKQPDITLSKGDIGLEKNYGHLLQKKEIKAMIKISNSRNQAIIHLMAMSGLSQKEVRNLEMKKFVDSAAKELDQEIDNIDDLLKHEKQLTKDIILSLELTRKKVNYRCQSFIPPEVTERILVYLKERLLPVTSPIIIAFAGVKLTIKKIKNKDENIISLFVINNPTFLVIINNF